MQPVTVQWTEDMARGHPPVMQGATSSPSSASSLDEQAAVLSALPIAVKTACFMNKRVLHKVQEVVATAIEKHWLVAPRHPGRRPRVSGVGSSSSSSGQPSRLHWHLVYPGIAGGDSMFTDQQQEWRLKRANWQQLARASRLCVYRDDWRTSWMVIGYDAITGEAKQNLCVLVEKRESHNGEPWVTCTCGASNFRYSGRGCWHKQLVRGEVAPQRGQAPLLAADAVLQVGDSSCRMLPSRTSTGERPRAVVATAQRMTDAKTGGVELVVSLVTVTPGVITCIHRGHRSLKWLKHVNGGKKQCPCVTNTAAYMQEHPAFMDEMTRAAAALDKRIDETVEAVFDQETGGHGGGHGGGLRGGLRGGHGGGRRVGGGGGMYAWGWACMGVVLALIHLHLPFLPTHSRALAVPKQVF